MNVPKTKAAPAPPSPLLEEGALALGLFLAPTGKAFHEVETNKVIKLPVHLVPLVLIHGSPKKSSAYDLVSNIVLLTGRGYQVRRTLVKTFLRQCLIKCSKL